MLAFALGAQPAAAGTTGRLTGRVLDAAKQPLVGANVIVPIAHLGAASDAEGRYVITNLPAGTYEVKVSLIGYRPTTIQDVRILADNTTTLDLKLEEAPVEIGEVVVSAKRPVVDVNLTSNLASVSREEIAKLPVQELQDVVNLQAGVVDGHFRGGRTGEVQYQVDGVSVNNPYDNTSTLRLDRSLLQEVQVISGTFDAEYGQAMSGVVNAVLRRGSDKFEWNAEAMLGGYPYSSGAGRIQAPDFDLTDVHNFQVSASGPAGLPKTNYLLNLRNGLNNSWIHGLRTFTTARDTSVPPEPPKYFFRDGDYEDVVLGYTREWSGLAKISNRSLSRIELSYQAVANDIDARTANWLYRRNPDGMPLQHTFSINHGGDLTHTLNPSSYYNLSVRQNYYDKTEMVYEDLYDPRYDASGGARGSNSFDDGAYYAGVDLNRSQQTTNALVVKGAYVNEGWRLHRVKVGGEAQWPKVYFGHPGYVVEVQGPSGTVLDRYLEKLPQYPAAQTYHPFSAAAYAQDEIEWEGLRLRAGLRFDFFDARTTVPSDPSNPANDIAGAPESVPVSTTAKVNWSPRLGVSYPITSGSSLFFAYGHFYQMPALGQIFDNANYGTLSQLQARVSYDVVGNPDIHPEETVQYQFGYKQAVTPNLGVDVNAFYKDIRNLLGVEFISTYNDAEYPRLTNVDFGSVIGVTLAVDQRDFGPLSIAADYTWQRATGNSSDPRETATRAENHQDPRPRQLPFNWDQLHTFNLTATVVRPDRYIVSGVLRMGSGQPYTPETGTGGFGNALETNSGRKPLATLFDVRAESPFKLNALPVTGFVRVFNVFDARYFNGFVFASTGSPYYSSPPGSNEATLGDPTRFYGPRRFEIGLTTGGGR